MIRLGINGFGRIGRNVLRASLNTDGVDVVAVNDLTDAGTLAHLLKYDSVSGVLDAQISHDGSALSVNGKSIFVSAKRDPSEIPWKELGAEIVIESTGFFTDPEKASLHIQHGGAKRVIISAPAKGDALTIVMGVNHDRYDPKTHFVISNGSCTTNALAPAAKVLNDAFRIEHGMMVTTHAYTNSQALHDQPLKNLRAARSAALSIIPYSTGAAKAIGKVIPELDGKLSGFSLRVPVPVVSIVDLTVDVAHEVTVEAVNSAFREAAAGNLKGILGYNELPLVSADYQGDSRSSVIDGLSTMVIGKRMVKVMAWYDNEWAFSKRLLDLSLHVASKGM